MAVTLDQYLVLQAELTSDPVSIGYAAMSDAHAATDTFDVTNASTAVNTSSTGDGMVRLVATQAAAANVVLNFAASSFVLTQA